MKQKMFCLFIFLSFSFCSVHGEHFTVGSYNLGGLSDHYDYYRTAAMQKLMQERYDVEPQEMAKIEKIQQTALKALFSNDPTEKESAQRYMDSQQEFFTSIASSPQSSDSPNHSWFQKSDSMVTSYKERPIILRDEEVKKSLFDHIQDLVAGQNYTPTEDINDSLNIARRTMTTRALRNHLKYDILCIQEATYFDDSMLSEQYAVLFSEAEHSVNAIAWNKNRFELVESLGNILNRAFVIHLKDKESGKTVAIASGHITGCNPFMIITNPETGERDSAKGDSEIQKILDVLNSTGADLQIIGMDSNVTGTHPRLQILKNADFQLDSENYLDMTCTNPYQVLNTRLDWIAVKAHLTNVSITNIPVLGIGLNSIQTNVSDHKPIAAKINY